MPIAIVGPIRSRERAWSASAARGAISSSRAPRTSIEIADRRARSRSRRRRGGGRPTSVQSCLVTSPWTRASSDDLRPLVAVAGRRRSLRRCGSRRACAAGGEEVAVDRAGDEGVAAEDDHVAVDVAGDSGVAADDEDAVDGLAAGNGDVAGDDDDRRRRASAPRSRRRSRAAGSGERRGGRGAASDAMRARAPAQPTGRASAACRHRVGLAELADVGGLVGRAGDAAERQQPHALGPRPDLALRAPRPTRAMWSPSSGKRSPSISISPPPRSARKTSSWSSCGVVVLGVVLVVRRQVDHLHAERLDAELGPGALEGAPEDAPPSRRSSSPRSRLIAPPRLVPVWAAAHPSDLHERSCFFVACDGDTPSAPRRASRPAPRSSTAPSTSPRSRGWRG